MADRASRAITVLQRAGFKGERLKTAFGIVMRESGGNPQAHNPNRATGDDSYGLAQINMLGQMGPARRRQFGIQSNRDLFDPDVNARAMFQMSRGGRDFGAWGIGPNAYRSGAGMDTIQPFIDKFPGVSTRNVGDMPPAARQPQRAPGATPTTDPRRALALALVARSRERRGADPIVERRTRWEDGSSSFPWLDPTRVPSGTDWTSLITKLAMHQATTPFPVTSRATGLPKNASIAKLAAKAEADAWGGSKSIAARFRDIAKQNGLAVMSEKRKTKNTASGGVSDHWVGSKDAYAFDLSNGSKPTPEMDRAAQQIMAALGVEYDGKSELVRNVYVNGYRVQVIYRSNVGGNHFNHIHVGVRKQQ